MGKKRTPGLYFRNGIWHIDKTAYGKRICESTRTSSLEEAESYLIKRLETLRNAAIYGIRPKRTFREAATKYLNENTHKTSICDDANHLKTLEPFIGDKTLEEVHMGSLQGYINQRRAEGKKTKTINLALGTVRRILNLAATEWIDENCLTWLLSPPKIKLLKVQDARDPYQMSWDEQRTLFQALPDHLEIMALFKVNTGCREQEVCQLRWEWEKYLPNLKASIFVVPANYVKNGLPRVIVLNRVAINVIDKVRGNHPKFVFTYKGKPITAMNNTAWQNARKRVNLTQMRVHDLKHTFGSRLRDAGVQESNIQDLLGHKQPSITRHYSVPTISKLIRASDQIYEVQHYGPRLSTIQCWDSLERTGSQSSKN